MDRAGLRRKLLKAQAEAGDIVLLFGDESEALTHPYLAHAWAKRGADLRVPAPGQAAKVAMLGVLDCARRDLVVRTSRTKRGSDVIALLEELSGGETSLAASATRRASVMASRRARFRSARAAPAPPSPCSCASNTRSRRSAE